MAWEQRRGPKKEPLRVLVTGERDGRERTSALNVQRMANPEADFRPGSDLLEDFKANEDRKAYRPLHWRRVGDPTWRYDCAGLVLNSFWPMGPYWVTAPELYTNFLVPFGERLSSATGTVGAGDVMAFRGEGTVKHVAIILNSTPVRSLVALKIRTKDGEESTFENTAPLFGPGASSPIFTSLGINPHTIQNELLLSRYDGFEFWRIASEVRASLRFRTESGSSLDALLTVRAEDEAGNPLSGAQVLVSFPGKGEALRKGTTNGGGSVSFASIPGTTGKRLVRVFKDGYKPGEATVELMMEQPTACTIRLAKTKPPPRPDPHSHIAPPKRELVVLSVTATPERVGRGQRVEVKLVYEARGLPEKSTEEVTVDETVTLRMADGVPIFFPTKRRTLSGRPARGVKIFEGRFTKPGAYRWSCKLWANNFERNHAELTFQVQ